jgi:hypothetical protein
MRKILVISALRFWALFADLPPISSIEDWRGRTCHADVSDLWRVRWFWGLTCDFWAENGREKITARAKAYFQSLRPSGFAPAFGRAVGPFAPLSASVRTALKTGSEAVPFWCKAVYGGGCGWEECEGVCGWARVCDPTHRKQRDGWGTRVFVLANRVRSKSKNKGGRSSFVCRGGL